MRTEGRHYEMVEERKEKIWEESFPDLLFNYHILALFVCMCIHIHINELIGTQSTDVNKLQTPIIFLDGCTIALKVCCTFPLTFTVLVSFMHIIFIVCADLKPHTQFKHAGKFLFCSTMQFTVALTVEQALCWACFLEKPKYCQLSFYYWKAGSVWVHCSCTGCSPSNLPTIIPSHI